jgi:hypothetical protein
MRTHRIVLIVSAISMGAVMPAASASATTPSAVHFDVPTTFGAVNRFTASGAAVDNGLICSRGDVIDVIGKASGFQSGLGGNFLVVKEFVCDDGSGSFTVKLQVRLDFRAGTDTFSWVILGGTSDYADLHGRGSGVGVDGAENFVRDVYDGAVHVD